MTTLELDRRERDMLAGKEGPAMQFAMELVQQAARILKAPRLVPVTMVHVDACFYVGEPHVGFAQFLVDHGARFTIPAWTNIAPASVSDPDPAREAGDPEIASGSKRLMALYEAMGCKPVWTCAPYQLPGGPKLGEHIVVGESNAVAYYNAAVGARSNKYGDYLDVACGLIGKAPYAKLHTEEGRRGDLLIEVVDVPEAFRRENIFFHLLGHLVGHIAGRRIPVIEGLPETTRADDLKAVSAAVASSGGVEHWHGVGVTPEAPTRDAAFGGRAPEETVRLGPDAFVRAMRELSGAADGPLDLVALGTPHFSPTEFQALHRLLAGRRVKEGLPVIVSTSRFVKDFIAGQGILAGLERCGVRVIADTCTYFTPAIREAKGRVMTNAAKWAYYAPGMLPVEVVFGSLAECVESAVAGEVRRDRALWTGFGGNGP